MEWLSEQLMAVTAIPMLAMMVHVTLDVTLKYTVGLPIQGTLEIVSYYYMVAIVVLPMSFVEWSRQSISVDLFYQMMSFRMQVAIMAFVLLLCAAGYGFLAWISLTDAMEAFARREIAQGTITIYIWPTRFLLPIALSVSALVCLVHLLRLLTSHSSRAELIGIHQVDTSAGVD